MLIIYYIPKHAIIYIYTHTHNHANNVTWFLAAPGDPAGGLCAVNGGAIIEVDSNQICYMLKCYTYMKYISSYNNILYYNNQQWTYYTYVHDVKGYCYY